MNGRTPLYPQMMWCTSKWGGGNAKFQLLYLREQLELSVQFGFSARLVLLLYFPRLPATFPTQLVLVWRWNLFLWEHILVFKCFAPHQGPSRHICVLLYGHNDPTLTVYYESRPQRENSLSCCSVPSKTKQLSVFPRASHNSKAWTKILRTFLE